MDRKSVKWGRCARTLMVIALIAAVQSVASAQVRQGTLATQPGTASIKSNDLAAWINEFIPAATNRLISMTQCYGGNSAASFAGQANTAVISATSPGQLAYYGGYDNDAAGAMTTGAANTGATVHAAGTAGKDPRETPSTNGGLAPGAFSLAPVNPVAGPIKSRHVVIYAGQPDGGNGTSDAAQRAAIMAGLAGPNTTFHTAGGAGGGAGGWTHAGTPAGLRAALAAAGAAITGGGNPAADEQFILAILDHGDLHATAAVAQPVAPSQTVPLYPNFQTFTPTELDPQDLSDDPYNVPGFSVFLPYYGMYTAPEGSQFAPGAFTLHLDNVTPSGTDYHLDSFFDVFVELDGSGIIGDYPGEGVRVQFELPDPDTSGPFVSSFFDVFYDISLTNNTGNPYMISEVSQDTGEMVKPLPEPGTFVLLAFAGAAILNRRRLHA